MIELSETVDKLENVIQKREWSNYSVNNVDENLSKRLDVWNVVWNNLNVCCNLNLNVCGHWNALERIIIDSTDDVAPLKSVKVNYVPKW